MLPVPTVAGKKSLAIKGGTAACTVKVALAVRPVDVAPLLIVVTVEVVLL